MTTKRKEMIQIQESVQKLKQQMALLSKDVRLQESKRKVELKRQERMDRQFLNQKVGNLTNLHSWPEQVLVGRNKAPNMAAFHVL